MADGLSLSLPFALDDDEHDLAARALGVLVARLVAARRC